MATAHDFAAAAASAVDARWRLHGRNPAIGLDCGGLFVWSLRQVGVEVRDVRDYDARMPSPALLWAMCREHCDEAPWGDMGEGRVGLCSLSDGGEARHLVAGLADRRIVHVEASVRKVVVVPANWLDGRLVAAFRVRGLEYGAPW